MLYLKARLPYISILLVAMLTMLFSASCGCGSGSSGPSAPTRGDYVSDPIETWPYPRYEPPVYKDPLDITTDILHQRWAIATNYREEIGFNRVEEIGAGNIENWGRLKFLPFDRENNQQLPRDMAYAVYGFKTYDFSAETYYPVYVELDWYDAPLSADVWIGVHTYEGGNSRWDWIQPYSDMTAQLSPLWMYRSGDPYETVYVAVVVNDGAPCTLQEVALRQYRW